MIDSAKVWLKTQGLENRKAGQPVIVFESGRGSAMGNWERVVAGAVDLAPIFTYDRAGVGKSDAIEEMPTIKSVSDRLVRILNHLEIEPPYLLVGHSLGGLYAGTYKSRLVLVMVRFFTTRGPLTRHTAAPPRKPPTCASLATFDA